MPTKREDELERTKRIAEQLEALKQTRREQDADVHDLMKARDLTPDDLDRAPSSRALSRAFEQAIEVDAPRAIPQQHQPIRGFFVRG